MSLRTFDSEVINLRTIDGETLYDIIESDVIETHTTTPSSALEMASGTAAAPGLYFDADPDTGFYRVSANTLGLASGGVQTASFSTSAFISKYQLRAPTGSAGTPSYSFEADTATGMYYDSGTQSINYSRNGINFLTLISTGITSQAGITVDVDNASALLIRKNGAAGDIFTVDTSSSLVKCGGQLQIPTGSLSAPGIAFSSDTDTGIYSEGTNLINLVAGGSSVLRCSTAALTAPLRFEITTSSSQALYVYNDVTDEAIFTVDATAKQILCPIGTVSAPGIAFEADPNTGFYSVADDLYLSLAGVERASFTTSLASLQLPMVIDATSAEAFLVRADGDTGDIFTVDTSTPRVKCDGKLWVDITDTEAFIVGKNADGGDILTVNTTSERVTVDGTTPELYIGNGTSTTQNDLNFYVSSGTSLVRWYEGATLRAYIGHGTATGTLSIINSQANKPITLATNGTSTDIQFSNDQGSTAFATFRTSSASFQSSILVDNTSTEALLIRKDADAGDVFTVDTTNSVCRFGGTLAFQSTSVNTSDTITLSSSPAFSATFTYLLIANVVHITWDDTTFTGTGSLNSSGLDTIPTAFRPAATVYIYCLFTNNGTRESRVIGITSAGVMTIETVVAGSASVTTSSTLHGGGGSFEL